MENLFSSFSHADSIAFLISVLATFLIGFVTGWALYGPKANRLQKEADRLKNSNTDLTAQLAAMKEQLDLRDADLVRANMEAAEAKVKLDGYFSERAKWQADLDASLEETVRLQASLGLYQTSVEDLNNQVLALQNANAALSGTNAELRLAQQQLPPAEVIVAAATTGANEHGAYDEAMARLGNLETQIAQLVAENEALRQATANEGQQLAVLHETDEAVAKRLAILEARVGNLVEENDALKAELQDIRYTPPVADIQADFEIPALDDDEPEPFIHSEKELLTELTASSSAAREGVLAAIGHQIPVAAEGEKDDLTAINGIGSFIEKQLNGLGICTYEQISQLTPDLIEKLTEAIEFFPGRIEGDDWVGQAKVLLEARNYQAGFLHLNDLKIVEGIGPKIELLLQGAGIKTLNDLAAASVDRLKEVLHKAGDHYRIHDPSTWPAQADLASQGDLAKLREYQAFLSGGRTPGN